MMLCSLTCQLFSGRDNTINVDFGARYNVFFHKFTLAVYFIVRPVAIKCFVIFLCPAGVNILPTLFVRPVVPKFIAFAFFDLFIFRFRVAVSGKKNTDTFSFFVKNKK